MSAAMLDEEYKKKDFSSIKAMVAPSVYRMLKCPPQQRDITEGTVLSSVQQMVRPPHRDKSTHKISRVAPPPMTLLNF